jgi:hypothetical protein
VTFKLRLRAAALATVVATVVTTVPAVAAAAAPAPTPAPSTSVPSQGEVTRAKEAADAAAKEVADISAEVARAEEALQALQRGVAQAVSAQERAERDLAAAEAAVRQAAQDLAAARRAREDAERLLSGSAALMYMQGGDLRNMTTLLLSPPGAVSDLKVVLDRGADEVRHRLDAARSAAVKAAAKERLLTLARDRSAAAHAEAAARRAAAEKEAQRAGAEAARLGARQEQLTARLDQLQQGAEDLAALREEAARRADAALLGLQGAGAVGSAPRAAQQTARSMLASYGWDDAQFPCLVDLWNKESGWSWSATNASSGAYGIPQSLPGWKMASAGSDWLTNPATQIAWGMGYIASVYGSPCGALDAWLARSPHWY